MDPTLLYLQAFFEREKVVSTWPFYVDRKICAAVENACNADSRVPYLEGRGDRTTGFLPAKTLLQTAAVNNTRWSDGVRFKVVIRDQRGLESAVEWKPEAPIPLLTSAHGLV